MPFKLAQLIVFALLVLCSRTGGASTFCVDNAVDLANALSAASSSGLNGHEDNTIKVVVGTYTTGAASAHGPFAYYSSGHYALTIRGGYRAGCDTRTDDATATIIDGASLTGAMSLSNRQGQITVFNLMFQHGYANTSGGGLHINVCDVGICLEPEISGASATVTHCVFRHNTVSDYAGGGLSIETDTLNYVAHNLFLDNTTGGLAGGAAKIVADGGSTQFYGNTVVENTAANGAGSVGGLVCGGAGPCQIYDNILWQNSGFGLRLTDPGAVLLFNDFGERTGHDPLTDIGNVSEDPRFVDLSGGHFSLSGTSPLLGISSELLGGNDLEGNPYPATGRQDLGAFEDTVFVDSFDPQ